MRVVMPGSTRHPSHSRGALRGPPWIAGQAHRCPEKSSHKQAKLLMTFDNFMSRWQIYIDVIAGLTWLDPQSTAAHEERLSSEMDAGSSPA